MRANDDASKVFGGASKGRKRFICEPTLEGGASVVETLPLRAPASACSRSKCGLQNVAAMPQRRCAPSDVELSDAHRRRWKSNHVHARGETSEPNQIVPPEGRGPNELNAWSAAKLATLHAQEASALHGACRMHAMCTSHLQLQALPPHRGCSRGSYKN